MTDPGDVLAVVREVFGRRIGRPAVEVDPDVPAMALEDMESIEVLRAIAQIEDLLGVAIPDELLFDGLTLRALAEVVTGLPRRPENR